MRLRRRGDRVQPRPLDGHQAVCRKPGPALMGAWAARGGLVSLSTSTKDALACPACRPSGRQWAWVLAGQRPDRQSQRVRVRGALCACLRGVSVGGSWEESRRSLPASGSHTLSRRVPGFLGSLAGNGNKRCRNASGASLPFSGFPVGSHEYQPWRNGIPAPGWSRESWTRVLW